MRLKNLFTVPRFKKGSQLVVVFSKNGSAEMTNQVEPARGYAGGLPGSGAGKGGGGGGTIRESGGGLGQFGAAQEEGYFHKRSRQQLEEIKKMKEQKKQKKEEESKQKNDGKP